MFEDLEDLGSIANAAAPAPASPPAGGDCQQTLPQTKEGIGSGGDFRTVCRPAAPIGSPPTSLSAARPAAPPASPTASRQDLRRKRVLPAWMLAAVAGSAPSGPEGIHLVFS